MNMRKLIIVLSVILCTSLIFTSCEGLDFEFIKGEFSTCDEYQEKVRASDFTVYDQLNNKVSYSDHKGKPTVVLFYGVSYSVVTREYMMMFDTIYRKYKDKVNFMIVHLSCFYMENKENAETLVAGLSFPAYFDLDRSAEYAYSVTGHPRTIIIDADGYIYHDQTGTIDSSYLEKHIGRVLNGEPYVTEVPKRCGCYFK